MREQRGPAGPGSARAEGALTIHPALRRMCERFPLLRQEASVRFAWDETFRDMCEDYDTCAETLAHLESSPAPPEGLRAEYAALLLRLERELLRQLGERSKYGES
jgi:hypothetical protein